MATSHYCPDGTRTIDGWAEGSTRACPYHGVKLTNMRPVRMGLKDRRKADTDAGVVGQQRKEGYING